MSFLTAFSKGNRGVLGSLIRMMDDLLGASLPHGHIKSVEHQLRAQMRRHGPADNTATPYIEDDGQIQKAGPRWDVGNIRDPELIRAGGCKIPLDQVRRFRLPLLTTGRLDPRTATNAL